MPHKTRVSQASQIESSTALERLEKSRLVSTFVPTKRAGVDRTNQLREVDNRFGEVGPVGEGISRG